MTRYKLIVEYDGSALVGWQRQKNGPSAQEHIERALHALTGEEIIIHAAGRTDAGVHATGQVIHFDLAKYYAPRVIQNALNYHLKPAPVGITHAEEVGEQFHARFSARRRRYCYRILNRKAPPILDANRVWHVKEKLDVSAMRDGASFLLGNHDFTSFRATACQAKSPIKTLELLDILEQGEELHFIVGAPSFLHHMVRNLVGTLKLVGNGQWAAMDVKTALEAKDRARGGPTAPPQGLYLTHVFYD